MCIRDRDWVLGVLGEAFEITYCHIMNIADVQESSSDFENFSLIVKKSHLLGDDSGSATA